MMLPTEILDIVFSQIHLKTAAPTPKSQATFSSLCLTSKHFLPLAREYLYYRPIRLDNAYRKPAIALLCTLAAPRSIAAQLVRSLQGLVDYIGLLDLDGLGPPLSALPHLLGYKRSFEYLVKILEPCISLHTVDLTFSSTEEFMLVQQALQGSSPTLKIVHFKSVDGYRLPKKLANEGLRSETFKRIEAFEWTSTDIVRSPISTSSVLLPLKSLKIREEYGTLEDVKQFFPIVSSSLTAFAIQVEILSNSDIDYIFNSLPSTLLRLSVSCLSTTEPRDFRPSLSRYLQDQILSKTRFSDISRFASLLHFQLNGLKGPSLAMIQTLSTSSPLLTSLDFSNSYWDRVLDSSGANIANSIFPVTEISDVLARLGFLRFVNFGYLPSRNRAYYRRFMQELERRGIEVEWKECRPLPKVCGECGSRH